MIKPPPITNPFTHAACSVADLHSSLHHWTPKPSDIPAIKEAIATEKSRQNRVSVINLLTRHMKHCEKAKEVRHGM